MCFGAKEDPDARKRHKPEEIVADAMRAIGATAAPTPPPKVAAE